MILCGRIYKSIISLIESVSVWIEATKTIKDKQLIGAISTAAQKSSS